MPDFFRQDEDATEVMDDQSRPDVVFAGDVNAGYDHARDVNKKIQSDKNLADDRDFHLISPGSESVDHYGKGAELEERRDSFAKKCLVLWTYTKGACLAAEVGSDGFEHVDACFSLV